MPPAVSTHLQLGLRRQHPLRCIQLRHCLLFGHCLPCKARPTARPSCRRLLLRLLLLPPHHCRRLNQPLAGSSTSRIQLHGFLESSLCLCWLLQLQARPAKPQVGSQVPRVSLRCLRCVLCCYARLPQLERCRRPVAVVHRAGGAQPDGLSEAVKRGAMLARRKQLHPPVVGAAAECFGGQIGVGWGVTATCIPAAGRGSATRQRSEITQAGSCASHSSPPSTAHLSARVLSYSPSCHQARW